MLRIIKIKGEIAKKNSFLKRINSFFTMHSAPGTYKLLPVNFIFIGSAGYLALLEVQNFGKSILAPNKSTHLLPSCSNSYSILI